jgi:drug/metabolite transporter (DMT)-like permease
MRATTKGERADSITRSHRPDHAESAAPSIWWWAFGYFACYVPYTALTKMLSKPLIATGRGPVSSLEILPPMVMASVVTSVAFLLATGWWRRAGRRRLFGRSVPAPGLLTLLSGLCSAGIIVTTTLAYTFSGISLVLVGLLMRGGVLVIAPIVDRITGRRVRWFSWVALGLSMMSLVAAFVSSRDDARMPVIAAIDIACYLGCYFSRLTLMSRKAKADDATNLRYFVEEQLVSSPALLLALVLATLFVGGAPGQALAAGFTTFFGRPVWLLGLAVGVMSQGTGIFGGLIFLNHRENTFCVPVNRASSVLAVIVASIALSWAYGSAWPHREEWIAAGLILSALAVLTIAPLRAKPATAARATEPSGAEPLAPQALSSRSRPLRTSG